MSEPLSPWLPRRLSSSPATVSGVLVLLVLTGAFAAAGVLNPNVLPSYASSRREVIGMALMLITLPAYFVAAAIAVRRHSLSLVEAMRPATRNDSAIETAHASIEHGLSKIWSRGILLGLLLSWPNTSIVEALAAETARNIHIAISLGQILLWLCVGLFFIMRLDAARTFRRLSEIVDIDLFALDRLHPLARSGLADVMVVAGALAFSPLQSLDAEFRLYNYTFGMSVAIVASSILLIWPLQTIHRRIRDKKNAEVTRLNQQIAELPRSADPTATQQLELLLLHRDRVADLGTWLLSTSLVSRVFLYLIIPPLAWVGAAIVERFVDQILAS